MSTREQCLCVIGYSAGLIKKQFANTMADPPADKSARSWFSSPVTLSSFFLSLIYCRNRDNLRRPNYPRIHPSRKDTLFRLTMIMERIPDGTLSSIAAFESPISR